MNVIIPTTNSEYETQIKAIKKAENIAKKLLSESEQEILSAVDDTFNMNLYAVILYTLFKSYGFTGEQLEAFFTEVNSILKSEIEADEYCLIYGIIPQRTALKDELGIDIEALYEEAGFNG